jgi:hypothetical protein
MARQSYSAETTQVVTEGALQRELADDAIDSHSTHAQCAFLRPLRSAVAAQSDRSARLPWK